jgi:hypothetical protein
MSLKHQQFESLKRTKDFMYSLLDPKKRPKTVKEMKDMVSRCLRHYPPLKEDGEPMFSNDNFNT